MLKSYRLPTAAAGLSTEILARDSARRAYRPASAGLSARH